MSYKNDSWKNKVRKWDGKLYKILQGNKSCHGGDFEWSLPEGDKPGDWTPIIEDVKMCLRGYHLTTHYAHWSDEDDVFVYEAEGDVVEFDGYDKVVCTKVRLLRLVENPFNKNNSGENNSGENNSGDRNSGNYNSGDKDSGNYNTGNYNSGSYNSGTFNSGDCNTGNFNSGIFNSGENNSGDGNSGIGNYGNYNSGSCNSGNYNSGCFNSGTFNSGNCNFGDKNSGSFNVGNGNSGYFCIDSPLVTIFGKSAPKDWIPKFPGWIYNLNIKCSSLEEYHASWQKAFEDASIEGIKELLALPNFNYEIFEKITSITKEQIERKLGEE